jgi:hypothetical protein
VPTLLLRPSPTMAHILSRSSGCIVVLNETFLKTARLTPTRQIRSVLFIVLLSDLTLAESIKRGWGKIKLIFLIYFPHFHCEMAEREKVTGSVVAKSLFSAENVFFFFFHRRPR